MATVNINATTAEYTYDGYGSWRTSSTDKLFAGISSSSTDYRIALVFDLSSLSAYTINSVAVYLYQTDYVSTVRWEVQNATTKNANGTVSGTTGSTYTLMNKDDAWKAFYVSDLSSMLTNGIVYLYGASASTFATVYDATTAYIPYIVVDYTIPTPETNDAYVVAGAISGTELTWGTPLNHDSDVWGQKIANLDGDAFALTYPITTGTAENVKTFSVSGTTITEEDDEQWLASTSPDATIIRLSDTKFLITYDEWDGTNFQYDTKVVACTVDGAYAVTVGTPLKLADDANAVMSALVDTDRITTIYNDGDYKMATMTLSGTAITLVDTITLADDINELVLTTLDDDKVLVAYRYILNNGAGRANTITTNDAATGTFYARHADITVTGSGSATMFIKGKLVKDNTSTYSIDNSVTGQNYTNDNELIDDDAHALSVGTHINDLLSNRKRVSLQFRYDPQMDIADTIKHITTYTTDNIFSGDLKVDYNGAFIATLEGTVIE